MDRTSLVIATLVIYKLILIAIGFWARSRTRNEEDFFLGGRGLGPVVAAISYSSSASSAWTLLGVSGMAYVIGISVVWIAAGSFTGMLLAWFWIAPRLMRLSRERKQITLTGMLGNDTASGIGKMITVVASIIIVFSFTFYVAAQFQGAGTTFASTFELSMTNSIIIGALIIMIYTLLGGFWAVSVTDTVQGLLMAFTAVLLPVVAITAVGGPAGFVEGLREVSTPGQLSWSGGSAGLVMTGVILGSLSISFGTYGQPHLMVRFMALRDSRALRQARLITIIWYLIVFSGMCIVGLAGHILHQSVGNSETIFFVLTESLFSPVLGSIVLAAVLSAIMSTADSQLLVAASAIAHDLGLGKNHPQRNLLISRLTIVGLVVLAVTVALFMPEKIFSRVLFAWSALGAAFGPTLFFRLAQVDLKPAGVLLAIITGFSLSVVFYLLPDTPGDYAERLLPFVFGTIVLFLSRRISPASLTAGQR